MPRSIARIVVLALLVGSAVVVAQNKRALTAADYDRAVKMLAPGLNGLVVNDSVTATWLAVLIDGEDPTGRTRCHADHGGRIFFPPRFDLRNVGGRFLETVVRERALVLRTAWKHCPTT